MLSSLEETAAAFVEMAHRIVWATVATVDGRGRPRGRILHPYWVWDGPSLVGWIATGPTPVKRAHLEASPFVSVTTGPPTTTPAPPSARRPGPSTTRPDARSGSCSRTRRRRSATTRPSCPPGRTVRRRPPSPRCDWSRGGCGSCPARRCSAGAARSSGGPPDLIEADVLRVLSGLVGQPGLLYHLVHDHGQQCRDRRSGGDRLGGVRRRGALAGVDGVGRAGRRRSTAPPSRSAGASRSSSRACRRSCGR